MPLTEDEVARRAESTSERVRQLVALGILTPGPDADGPFREADAQLVRLVGELEALGVPPTTVASAMSTGKLSLSYLDKFPGPAPRSARTYAQLSQELALPFGLLDQVYAGFGLSHPRPDEYVREDDAKIVSGLSIMFAAGLDESEVLRAARVWGEGVRGVAQHQVYSFHELIEKPFRQMGLSDDRVLDAALSEVGVRLIPYCQQLVGWLYRRHFETYATEHRVGHLETALEMAGLHRRSLAHPQACVFADLSGYTRLIDQLGDAAAAEIGLRLADLTQQVSDRYDGRVVKMLGDGVHYIFHEPSKAVLGSLEFVAAAEQRALPPVHIGVSAGPMIYTDGDYYGLAVIVAARIAARAGPGQVLVSEAVAASEDIKGVRFEELGPVSLKGVSRPMVVFRAVPTESEQ